MDHFFSIKKRNSTIKTEIIAGITTFLSMSYILFVNPSILSESGMDAGAVFTSTAIAAIIACLIMGLYANYPVALAPGMGMNAFFTYSVVLTMGYSWQEALFAIFVSGLIFLGLSLSGIREQIINMIPNTLKHAVAAGIGLFIAFIGLKNAGIIVANDATLVSLGDLSSPMTLLATVGILIAFVLTARGVKASIFVSMAIVAIIGVVLQVSGIDLGIIIPDAIVSMPPSIEPVFGQLFTGTEVPRLLLDPTFWLVVLSFLFVDFFDTTGTLVAVGMEADMIDEKGNLKDSKKALLADASATTIGAIVGTSSTTSYVESLAGVKAGGRTGLTAVVVAACFLIASFLSPLLSIVTVAVTTPALVTVGAMMSVNKGKIDYSDFADAASAFITMLFMITTFSIAEGISAGFITYVVCKLGQGKFKEVHPLMIGLTLLFTLRYFV